MVSATNILKDLGLRRRLLGMPYRELGRRSHVPVSTLKRIMGGEATASFATVSAVADALGVNFSGAPSEDVPSMRERQARAKARTLVGLVQGTSALEGQAVDRTALELMEQRTVAELLSGPSRKLWGR